MQLWERETSGKSVKKAFKKHKGKQKLLNINFGIFRKPKTEVKPIKLPFHHVDLNMLVYTIPGDR